jgi:outer membrane protein
MLWVSGIYAADFTLGTVNAQKVIDTVAEGKRANDQVKKLEEDKQKILRENKAKYDKAYEDYTKQSSVIKEDERIKKEEELQGQMMALQQQSMSFGKELQDKYMELLAPINEKIKDVAAEVAKKNSIDLVLGQDAGIIYYAANNIDLTDDIIKAYDKKYPVKKGK